MTLKSNRRQFIAGSAAAAGAAAFPMPAVAQNAPVKVGLLAVKTGPLAAGGQHAEEGITSFLKEKNFTLSGRKIELLVADTGGSPAGARTKAQELVERDRVNVVLGLRHLNCWQRSIISRRPKCRRSRSPPRKT